MVERTSGIDRLNRKAIADGLMLPGKRSLRTDFSDKLGEPLSMHELRVYTVIDKASRMKHWTKTDELAELFDADRFTVWAWINRIRSKLGETALVWKKDKGYQTSRAVIGRQVWRNKHSKIGRGGNF